MKILREFLAAYRERTEVMRAAAGIPVSGVEFTPAKSEVENSTPWEDWFESFGSDLAADDLNEVMWARSALAGKEPDGDRTEARAILTSHAVPKGAWAVA